MINCFFLNIVIVFVIDFIILKVDFGAYRNDNLVFDVTPTGLLGIVTLNGPNYGSIYLYSNLSIAQNQWAHVATTYNAGTMSLYINSQAAGSSPGFLINSVLRTTNYLGHSNWVEPNINATFDELKIFNRPLSVTEIATEMNKPQPIILNNF